MLVKEIINLVYWSCAWGVDIFILKKNESKTKTNKKNPNKTTKKHNQKNPKQNEKC